MATIGCRMSHKIQNMQINAAKRKQKPLKQNDESIEKYFFKIL